MFSRRGPILIAISLLLAVARPGSPIAGSSRRPRPPDPGPNTVAVLTAAIDIPLGTKIEARHVAAVQMLADTAPDSAFQDLTAIEGKIALAEIMKGEMLSQGALRRPGRRQRARRGRRGQHACGQRPGQRRRRRRRLPAAGQPRGRRRGLSRALGHDVRDRRAERQGARHRPERLQRQERAGGGARRDARGHAGRRGEADPRGAARLDPARVAQSARRESRAEEGRRGRSGRSRPRRRRRRRVSLSSAARRWARKFPRSRAAERPGSTRIRGSQGE